MPHNIHERSAEGFLNRRRHPEGSGETVAVLVSVLEGDLHLPRPPSADESADDWRVSEDRFSEAIIDGPQLFLLTGKCTVPQERV